MSDLYNSDISNAFFKRDIQAIDDFIVKYQSYGIYHPTLSLKWKYYDVFEGVEISEKDFISEDDSHSKDLNYNEIISLFDIERFLDSMPPVHVEVVNEFYTFCINYIDNFPDMKIKPLIISGLLDFVHRVVEALEDIKGTNNIQRATINYFLGLYDDLIQKVRERYESIYSEIFKEREIKDEIKMVINPYPQIFSDNTDKWYRFFEALFDEFKIDNRKYRDFSFIYRQSVKDKIIISREKDFRDWVFEKYELCFEKTKCLADCKSYERINKYQTVLSDFK